MLGGLYSLVKIFLFAFDTRGTLKNPFQNVAGLLALDFLLVYHQHLLQSHAIVIICVPGRF